MPRNAEDRQRVVVLQAAELALDGVAATVKPAPLVVLRDRLDSRTPLFCRSGMTAVTSRFWA